MSEPVGPSRSGEPLTWVFMAPLYKKGAGECAYNGVPCSLIRSGPKRHKSRRERKWRREKSHRRRRQKWSAWPKYKWPGYVYFVNYNYLNMVEAHA